MYLDGLVIISLINRQGKLIFISNPQQRASLVEEDLLIMS